MESAEEDKIVFVKQFPMQNTFTAMHIATFNLVLVDNVKMNPFARKFFTLLQCLCVYFESSNAHAVFMEKQHELHL